jgi:ABC-type transport system involved in multi-copper enzyme maturation permease subunit
MIWKIARREVLEAMLTGRSALLGAIAVALLGTGLFVMNRDYQTRRANFDLIRPESDQPIAVAAPNPLSVFARGLDDAMGRSFEVNAIGINIGSSQAAANPLFGLFPTPDWSYLFRVVFALVAFIFGFDLICAEKERGTLKLMVANGASRGEIAAGKWLGGWSAFMIPIGFAVLLWLALSRPVFGLALSGAQWTRVVLFLALAGIYLTVCYTIAVAISAFFHRSATALVAALFVWLLLVFVVPSFGVLAARQIAHVRPLALVTAERNRIFGSEMIKAFEEARANPGTSPFQQHWAEMHRQGDVVSQRVAGEVGALARTSAALVRLSPAGAFDAISTHTLGTSVVDEARLKLDVRRHKNSILPTVFEQSGSRSDATYPAFVASRASLGEVMAAGRADLSAMVIAGILALLALFVTVNRYDIR